MELITPHFMHKKFTYNYIHQVSMMLNDTDAMKMTQVLVDVNSCTKTQSNDHNILAHYKICIGN